MSEKFAGTLRKWGWCWAWFAALLAWVLAYSELPGSLIVAVLSCVAALAALAAEI